MSNNNSNYGASYSDDNFVIYSPQSDGTFSDKNYKENSVVNYSSAEEVEEESTEELSADELSQLAAIREIEKGIDYDAIEEREGNYEELYRTMSDKDKEIVVGLSEWLVNRGVIERQDTEALIEEENLDEIFGMTAAAAMSDSEVNPDSYSEDVIISSAVEETVHSSDTAGDNPEDYEDEEYDAIQLRKEPSEYESRAEMIEDVARAYEEIKEERIDPNDNSSFSEYDYSKDEKKHSYPRTTTREIISPFAQMDYPTPQEIVAKADEVLERFEQNFAESYDHSNDQESSDSHKIAVSDLSLIKKLLKKKNLSDADIADIIDGASTEDIAELRGIFS